MTEQTNDATAASHALSPPSEELGLAPKRDIGSLIEYLRQLSLPCTPGAQAADALTEQAAEIGRLRAALAKSNEQAERFERGWYLRGDALEAIKAWQDAQPHAGSGLTTIIEQGLKA